MSAPCRQRLRCGRLAAVLPPRLFTARPCLPASPPLQRGTIQYNPQLPANQTRVFEALGQGAFSKLWLQFEEPFWDTNAT